MMVSSSEIVGAMPPPPGQRANFVDPPNQNASTIALHTACLTLVTLCVGMRLYTRQFINNQLGADDYLCLLAYLLTIVFSALLILGNQRGLGKHMWDVPAVELPAALEALTIAEYIYLVLAATIKLSCLLFYRRVFSPSRKTLGFIRAGLAFVSAAYTAMFFSTLFECDPIKKGWNVVVPGHCLPAKVLPYCSGAINVISDIYVLILPIPCIWSLNLRLSRKLRALALFGLGIFVCATSIVRLGMTSLLYSDFDATWNLSRIGIWAVIEVNVGIMCACLLALPIFLEHYGLGLGSYFSRLKSYALSRRGGKQSGTSGTGKPWQPSGWSKKNRSDHIHMELSEYSKLNGNGDAAKTHHATTSNFSNEDIEACPRDNRETANPPLSLYPQAVHASKREAFERETEARLR